MHEKVRRAMRRANVSTEDVLRELDMSDSSFSARLTGRVSFKREEMYKLKSLLRLTDEEFMDIFFNEEDFKKC